MNFANVSRKINGRETTIMGLDASKLVDFFRDDGTSILVTYKDGTKVAANLMKTKGSVYQTEAFTASLRAGGVAS